VAPAAPQPVSGATGRLCAGGREGRGNEGGTRCTHAARASRVFARHTHCACLTRSHCHTIVTPSHNCHAHASHNDAAVAGPRRTAWS
jgi:hypothetical protein